MASWPIDLIKGHRNVRGEKLSVRERREETRTRIDAIRAKVGNSSVKSVCFRCISLVSFRFMVQLYFCP